MCTSGSVLRQNKSSDSKQIDQRKYNIILMTTMLVKKNYQKSTHKNCQIQYNIILAGMWDAFTSSEIELQSPDKSLQALNLY